MITESGVYPDISHDDYHADPVAGGSLSSSGARLLLRAPAKYAHSLTHPQAPRKVWDLGQAAHSLVLGAGPQPIEIPAGILASNGAVSTREAKAFVAAARAEGAVPLKPDEMETVRAMAEKLRSHPIAAALLDAEGSPEQTIVWRDEATGVSCRARLDWLPAPTKGRALNVDYKTTDDASEGAFQRTAARLGYHLQGAWYEDAILATGTAREAATLWIVQEREAPYLVAVHQLGIDEMELGRDLGARACRIYAACTKSGKWPGYPARISTITYPEYVFRDAESILGGDLA